MSVGTGETSRELRFEFGANWRRFLSTVDEDRIREAVASLRKMLEMEDLGGKRFLDIGCGSGLSVSRQGDWGPRCIPSISTASR